MTARRSSILVSSVGTWRTGSERPLPRLSNRRTRAYSARSSTWSTKSGMSQPARRSARVPRTNTRSIGPSPTTWYAIATSPLRAYWTSGISGVEDGIGLRLAGHAFQLVWPSVVELDPRAGDEILDSARDQHLPRGRSGRYARACRDCDACHFPVV